MTVEGVTVKLATVGSVSIVSTALAVAPPDAPVIVALVSDVTAVVVMTNVAVVVPAGTFTNAGRAADNELLERLTMSPPIGAVPDKVTMPVEL